ncbi:MAG: hypothetical protein IM560_18990 [Pseudanabaena sp. M085S1SP2A07QC]|jgi:hypothetical protein|nr:hypothetical protein [Pseudanabaena sp. M090S1SP2A07QC]MCA6508758.1 hypothetical protein [Pseudanabaena sp. M109S1SP2A07QC]MCA6579470.1 hypothetical protein [Pseudanabaena sp. M085S1SP2A07QC]
MKDTDNSEFLNQREDNQLTLVFDVVVTPEVVRHANPKFEKFLEELRQEAKDIIAIASSNGGDYPNMKAIPNDVLLVAVNEYHRRNNIVRIEVVRTPNNKVAKAYSPWSLERKQKERIRKMMERLHKKYAIPEMFINAVLDDCAKNTQYFGLCQITGDRCDVRFAPPSVIAARAKELEMRQHEVVE